MEQTQLPSLHLQRFFKASPETVFDAWTQPEQMKKWLFKSDENELLHVHADIRLNGRFSILEKSEKDGLIDHFGEYHFIDRPNRLSFSLEVPKHVAGITQVDLKFVSQDEGCAFTFDQVGGDPTAVEESWRNMFQRLSDVLSTMID